MDNRFKDKDFAEFSGSTLLATMSMLNGRAVPVLLVHPEY